MEKEIKQNKFDLKGESLASGLNAEEHFRKLAEARNWKVIESPEYQDINEHWDFLLTKAIKVDVKAAKKITRNDENIQHEWLWIEFKGVKDDGWLYGKADVIVFEREKEFWFVRRKELAKRAEELVDQKIIVNTTREAKYKLYQRKGRRDLISMIEFSKIEDLVIQRWQKN
ncbi:hypothetical protein BH20ACI1_BH20ACI1_20310 [soil metagenome]